MFRMPLLAAMGLCLVSTSAMAKKAEEAPVDPGSPPASFQGFQRLATPALLAGFFDPEAARITWDRGLAGGYWKPVLSKKVPGWFTCGLVNGKNRMGGYVGARRFVAVYRNGAIVFSQIGDGGSYDFVEIGCNKAIQQGILPVAPPPGSAAATTPTIDPAAPRLGIGFNAVPQGAYIGGVEQGGSADKAGLVAGMVISHVNGVPLAGFDDATIAKILQAPAASLTLTIIGKGDVTLRKLAPGS